MDLSLFFAKWIGLYLLIVDAVWLLRRQSLVSAVKEIFASKGLLALSAELSLLFGLLIAIENPFMEWSWRGLITLIGYLSIFKGVMRLAFPDKAQHIASRYIKKWYWPLFFIILVAGIYLTYCGFNYLPA